MGETAGLYPPIPVQNLGMPQIQQPALMLGPPLILPALQTWPEQLNMAPMELGSPQLATMYLDRPMGEAVGLKSQLLPLVLA